ncbi:MAG: NAD(P)/FAD-dependent oxidoreductase, partial [Anaerolineales bacterium]|nr:NAD(P)/FAD-dependent oxidoreductase [Anaerolineales bacterium]
VEAAAWSSKDGCWMVRCQAAGEPAILRANFLLLCAGYYSYKSGYKPEFPGAATFQGQVVHPQEWPEDLDCRGKRIIVIGSGATAVTLVPALAKTAEHVVMLQRSPTYMAARPAEDKWARWLRYLLPPTWLYRLIRWKNIHFQQFVYRYSRAKPAQLKKRLLKKVREKLGPDFDVETHFSPSYNPWDERLCLVPDGDLFKAIKAGKAEVVTAEIERFTSDGIRLQSGAELAADIIVTATGLNLEVQGGIAFTVDAEPVDFARTFIYKGIMNSGVPNLINTFGYVNASWTLRADLIADYSCRLLNHMRQHGYRQATPRLRPEEVEMAPRPWSEEFTPGYIARSLDQLPKQGTHEPWLNVQEYELDKKLLIQEPLEDGVLQFDV